MSARVTLPAEPTGAELVAALRAEARRRGVTLGALMRPLTAASTQWCRQTMSARRPKKATVERVRAVLADRPLPTPASPPAGVTRGAYRHGLGDRPAPRAIALPTISIARLRDDDPALADAVEGEALRVGMELSTFIADLVSLGWRCHVEDLREAVE